MGALDGFVELASGGTVADIVPDVNRPDDRRPSYYLSLPLLFSANSGGQVANYSVFRHYLW